MNLSKLAKIANVSISTASKAFSGSSEISDSTKERIFAIAKENGCFEKYNNQKFEKKVVGVIIPENKSIYYTSVLVELEKQFLKHDIRLTVSTSNFSKSEELLLIQYYLNYIHVDALIVIDGQGTIKTKSSIPIVFIVHSSDVGNADCITLNGEEAIDNAVLALKQEGHKKIAFVGEMLTEHRYKSFIRAMKKNRMDIYDDLVIISDKRFESAGYNSMNKLFEYSDKPTAIFAAYSYIAQGILKCISEHNKNVPNDFSLISMDDIFEFPYSTSDISRIGTQTEEVCIIASDIIVKKLKSPTFTAKQHICIYKKFIFGKTIMSV